MTSICVGINVISSFGGYSRRTGYPNTEQTADHGFNNHHNPPCNPPLVRPDRRTFSISGFK